MSGSTLGGVVRAVPIIPCAATNLSLARGMVIQWLAGVVVPWLSGANVPFGVCTGDSDPDLLQVNVYVAKGCTVQLLCETGIVPAIGDMLYFSAMPLGSVSNVPDGNPAYAHAVGAGMNGMVEARIL